MSIERLGLEIPLAAKWFTLWDDFAPMSKKQQEMVTIEWIKIFERYSEPHRAYHTLGHIAYLLGMLTKYSSLAENLPALQYAVFRHDEYYFTERRPKGMPSNEALSAAAADETLSRASRIKGSNITMQLREEVHGFIMVTVHNPQTHPPKTKDEMLMADIDWSSLGWAWPDFNKNIKKIRHEYSEEMGYSQEEFNAGRLAFLKGALKRKQQFYLPEFKALYEQQAIHNIERNIRELENA